MNPVAGAAWRRPKTAGNEERHDGLISCEITGIERLSSSGPALLRVSGEEVGEEIFPPGAR